MKKITIIIPVYNNEGSLDLLYKKLIETLRSHSTEYLYEFIFINDGSKDNSLSALKSIQQNDQSVMVIDFTRNFGQMAGIVAGWKRATGDAIINISADLQDPPQQISKMLKEWESGHEVVISYRESRNDDFSSMITSKLAYKLLSYSVPDLPPGGFDFTLLDRKALDAVNSITERNRFYQADILWVGFSVKYLPYVRGKREHGSSGYTFFKRFNYFMTAFINVSYFPVRLMTMVGFLTTLFSAIYSMVIIYAYFYLETPFPGWAPIMMVVLFTGGVIMIMLGVIGEYIWRIYDEVKQRPIYLIKNIYSE